MQADLLQSTVYQIQLLHNLVTGYFPSFFLLNGIERINLDTKFSFQILLLCFSQVVGSEGPVCLCQHADNLYSIEVTIDHVYVLVIR